MWLGKCITFRVWKFKLSELQIALKPWEYLNEKLKEVAVRWYEQYAFSITVSYISEWIGRICLYQILAPYDVGEDWNVKII